MCMTFSFSEQIPSIRGTQGRDNNGVKFPIAVTIEENLTPAGNHFKEPDIRTAKGFAWLLCNNGM